MRGVRLYVSLTCNTMSSKRAELQRQIEELEADGIVAELLGDAAKIRAIYKKLAELYTQQDRLKD